MKIGYYYHVPGLVKDGGIYTPGYQAIFLEALANRCEELVCFLHSPAEDERLLMDTRLTAQNVRLIDLGPHRRAVCQILRAGCIVRGVRKKFKGLDLLLLRGPSPLLPEFSKQALKIPCALLLVGDYALGVPELPGSWFRRLLIYAWAKINRKEQDRAAGKALTFVNNRQLFNELKTKAARLREIRTSTVNRKDFYDRPDTCQGKPIRLLCAGRMDLSKGLEDIVEAVHVLVCQNRDLVLDFVGPDTAKLSVWNKLKVLIEEKNLQGRVCYHGNKTAGSELLEFFRKADVFVFASRASEGFPRVLWEAMASSLPIVATCVGSVPDYAASAVVLVEPKRPDLLSKAIASVLDDPEQRRKMILSGRQLAEQSAVDVQTQNMIREMELWAHESNREH